MTRSLKKVAIATGLALASAVAIPSVASAHDYGYYDDGYAYYDGGRYSHCRDRRDDNAAGGAVAGAIIGGAAGAVPGAFAGAIIGGAIGSSGTDCRYSDSYVYERYYDDGYRPHRRYDGRRYYRDDYAYRDPYYERRYERRYYGRRSSDWYDW